MFRIIVHTSVLLAIGAAACRPLCAQAQLRSSVWEQAQLVVSGEMLDQQSRRSTDETIDTRDEILGVPMHGRARIRGTTRFVLVPDEHRGVVDVVFSGTATSQTTSEAGLVRVRSRAVTHFTARQRFFVEEVGLTSSPAVCTAETHSQIVAVDTNLPGLRGRIARRIGWRRARRDQAKVDRIAAAHAARNVRVAFVEQVAPDAARVRDALASDFLQRAAGSGSRLRWRSSSDYLEFTVVRAGASGESQSPFHVPTAGTSLGMQVLTRHLGLADALVVLPVVMLEPTNAWLSLLKSKTVAAFAEVPWRRVASLSQSRIVGVSLESKRLKMTVYPPLDPGRKHAGVGLSDERSGLADGGRAEVSASLGGAGPR